MKKERLLELAGIQQLDEMAAHYPIDGREAKALVDFFKFAKEKHIVPSATVQTIVTRLEEFLTKL